MTSIYDRVVLRHPWLTLAALAALFVVLLPGLRNFKLDASTDALLLESDKALREVRQIAIRYKTRDFLFVAIVPKGDMLAPDTLDLISRLRDDLAAVDGVRDVTSVLDVPLLQIFEGQFADVATNFETLRSRDVNIEAARYELTHSPIYQDLVASSDGKVSAIQVVMKDHPELPRLSDLRDQLLYKRVHEGLSDVEERELAALRPDYERAKEEAETNNRRAIAAIRTVLARYRGDTDLYLGGLPMITDDMLTFIENDIAVFGLAVFAFLFVMLGVIFREPRWVALPFASCIYSSMAMFGLLGLIGWKVTTISSNFVSLMLILTMSMNIHLVVRYRELLRDGPERTQADLVAATVHDMARPSAYTVMTNIIGFISFALCDIKPVIDFGWMMSIGLVVAFAATFTLFPALLIILPRKPLRRQESDSYAITGLLARLTEKHGKLILMASLIIAVLAGLGTRRLEVENSFISYFHADTEIARGLKLIDEHLGGTTPLDIILKFPNSEAESSTAAASQDLAALFDDVQKAETAPISWFTDRKMDRIKAVHDYLESLPEVGKVLSFASTLRVAEDMNAGKPLGADAINQLYRRLPDAVQVNFITPYISVFDNQARVTARVIDSKPGLRRHELLQRIDADLRGKLHLAADEYQISGLLVLYNNVLQSLYRSQILTLGSAMALILVPLVIFFQSFRVALIGLIPNVLAALCILGFMGWAGIPLDIMTITIAAITVGIAVEDCIHYLYRYKIEYRRLGDPVAAMHYCHANIAKAGFYTTITVVVGFSILVLSNFIPTVLFGLLTAIAMIVALLGALTLMPTLILLWRPFERD